MTHAIITLVGLLFSLVWAAMFGIPIGYFWGMSEGIVSAVAVGSCMFLVFCRAVDRYEENLIAQYLLEDGDA